MKADTPNRSIIAVAGVLMQMALGAVYAWSVFRIPLSQAYGWTVSQVTVAFELAILVLGFAAFAGGLWMSRTGPRRVAILGAVLYGHWPQWARFSVSQTMSNGMLYRTLGRESIADWAGRLSRRTSAGPGGHYPDHPQSYRSRNQIHGQYKHLQMRWRFGICQFARALSLLDSFA